MKQLNSVAERALLKLAETLVDQRRARVIIPPKQAASGFWFGGGNMVEAPDGSLLLVGRYRNHGDSRTGLGLGERGLELAVFRSTDDGDTFTKTLSFAKSALDIGDRKVLSIEGSALRTTANGVELFFSTEKTGIPYPGEFSSFLKPGAGVWTVDHLQASSVEQLATATISTIFQSQDPSVIHMKDPAVYGAANGDTVLMFCTHPFCWSSSNTAFAVRAADQTEFAEADFACFPRGPAWDVAITRGTAIVDVPRVGLFQDRQVSLLFYDGGESLRNLVEHQTAVNRPRGYSCEELGGVAYIIDGDFQNIVRLSKYAPMFLSPYGTGCSRYVDVLATSDAFYATWQQSQEDLSQPLVMNKVDRNEVASLLDSD
ncbi:MAG: sialidase family protein [Pirellulaceae bacterium]|jgi:hypothetical protein|nr:sialidase family protein [Pirellulaceae bacterium]